MKRQRPLLQTPSNRSKNTILLGHMTQAGHNIKTLSQATRLPRELIEDIAYHNLPCPSGVANKIAAELGEPTEALFPQEVTGHGEY